MKLLIKLDSESNRDVLGFDSKLLKLCAGTLAPFLSRLFNLSFSTGTVLDDWKVSNVTPVFKGGEDKSMKSNYRPISVISHIAKILEKLVQKQLVQYVTDNNLLCIDQSAYRQYHNTQTSLHRCNEDWIDNICDNGFTSICFMDIRKCFDTIDHKILLNKLPRYGITGQEISWLKSYLEKRSQRVKCNGLSAIRHVPIGVPQGSVLGPILFSLFINDITSHVYTSSVNLYADDTLLYCYGNNLDEAREMLQKALAEICKWYDGNRLVLNVEKTKCMLMTSKYQSKKQNENLNIYLNEKKYCMESSTCELTEKEIEQVKKMKYLGVMIDDNLTWNDHISMLCKNLAFKVSQLSRAKYKVTDAFLITFYKTVIQPTIDYGITVWGHTKQENINKIQRLQNQAARIILNDFDYVNVRGIDLVKKLKWMNVQQRFDYFQHLLVFKCIHGMAPDYLVNEIVMDIEVRSVNTRSHDMNLHIPFPKNEHAKRSLLYSGAKNWNTLPNQIKEITSLDYIKSNLKTHVIAQREI